MTSLNSLNFVKRTAGLLSLLAASAALPVAAQMKPQPESAPSAPSVTTPGAPSTPSLRPANPSVTPTTPGTAPTVPNPVPGTTQPSAPSVTPPSATPGTRPAPEAATPTRPNPNVAATTGNIVQIASASDAFSTLVAALNEAELAQVLEGTGPFTVFAPTDAAFEALPAGTVEELLKPENRATLVQILKYHVVAGDYPSSALQSGQLPTAAGAPVTVTVANGSVKVDGANVIQPDIPASNGVIHAIDRVILPPRPSQAAPQTTPQTAPQAAPQTAPAPQSAPQAAPQSPQQPQR